MPSVAKASVVLRLAVGVAASSAGVIGFVFIRHAHGAHSARRFATANAPIAPATPVAGVSAKASRAGGPPAAETLAVASDDELMAGVRGRVAASLADAFAWAESQRDPLIREKMLFAIVRAWAETDPVAAIRWVLARESAGIEGFMEGAVTGAAKRPELAMEIGRMLLAADPELGATHGTMLVGALTGAGEFDVAFQFANTAPADLREEWLAAALRRWAAQKPEAAAKALDLITDDSLRGAVFRSLAEGWAERDPAGLAAYVLTQPVSPDRDYAWSAAIVKWGERDPTALAERLNTLPRGREFDAGAALLVTRTDQVNRSIDVALRWVVNISTPELRRDSLEHVLAEWAQRDPDSARAYLAQVVWLRPDERVALQKNVEQSGRSRAGIVAWE